MISAAFRECLETLDIARMRKMWRHLRPDMEQPKNDYDTLVSLHVARTECKAIRLKLRMYSHSWLVERGFPSLLPDHMRASAERMYPVATRAVGISINARSDLLRSVIVPVREAMENAVLESFAEHESDEMTKRHMMEAKHRALGKLLGLKR